MNHADNNRIAARFRKQQQTRERQAPYFDAILQQRQYIPERLDYLLAVVVGHAYGEGYRDEPASAEQRYRARRFCREHAADIISVIAPGVEAPDMGRG